MKLVIIADDLTVANDTGIQLAKQRISTLVTLDPCPDFTRLHNTQVETKNGGRDIVPPIAPDSAVFICQVLIIRLSLRVL